MAEYKVNAATLFTETILVASDVGKGARGKWIAYYSNSADGPSANWKEEAEKKEVIEKKFSYSLSLTVLRIVLKWTQYSNFARRYTDQHRLFSSPLNCHQDRGPCLSLILAPPAMQNPMKECAVMATVSPIETFPCIYYTTKRGYRRCKNT